MKDRSVQYPSRYKLTVVSGQADTYDLEAIPGTVTEVGTPLNKATFLSDTTATLYGLDSTGTIDDVLTKIPNKVIGDINNSHKVTTPVGFDAGLGTLDNKNSWIDNNYWFLADTTLKMMVKDDLAIKTFTIESTYQYSKKICGHSVIIKDNIIFALGLDTNTSTDYVTLKIKWANYDTDTVFQNVNNVDLLVGSVTGSKSGKSLGMFVSPLDSNHLICIYYDITNKKLYGIKIDTVSKTVLENKILSTPSYEYMIFCSYDDNYLYIDPYKLSLSDFSVISTLSPTLISQLGTVTESGTLINNYIHKDYYVFISKSIPLQYSYTPCFVLYSPSERKVKYIVRANYPEIPELFNNKIYMVSDLGIYDTGQVIE